MLEKNIKISDFFFIKKINLIKNIEPTYDKPIIKGSKFNDHEIRN